VSAGYDLARSGGVPAVKLREVTRRAGVTARAAYRHFDSHDALLAAVAAPALAELARTIERRLDAVAETDPAARAQACLQAVGEGYIAYALDEPGGFDIAFFGLVTMESSDDAASVGNSGRTPYQLLHDALEALADAGLTDPARLPLAATYCWSAVHGFATLATRGPIRDLPRETLDAMAAELVAATVAGLVRAG
jgi:AcrR family transcriptional regulator